MLPWRGPGRSERGVGLETVLRAGLRLWERLLPHGDPPPGSHPPGTGGHTCALLSTWENGLGLPTRGPLSVHYPHM